VAASATERKTRYGTAQPNIVFILADDLGFADVSCYGRRDFTTPNIDRLATEGVRFTQAYANSAVCTASRVPIITGRYQYRLSVGLEQPLSTRTPRKIGLPPDHPTLPSILKKAGYCCALVGKWHLGTLPEYGPLQSGYDYFYGFRSGAVDYFTHKSGSAATSAEDLWEGDVRIHRPGYLTCLETARSNSSKATPQAASLSSSVFTSMHRIGLGRRRATRRSRNV